MYEVSVTVDSLVIQDKLQHVISICKRKIGNSYNSICSFFFTFYISSFRYVFFFLSQVYKIPTCFHNCNVLNKNDVLQSNALKAYCRVWYNFCQLKSLKNQDKNVNISRTNPVFNVKYKAFLIIFKGLLLK